MYASQAQKMKGQVITGEVRGAAKEDNENLLKNGELPWKTNWLRRAPGEYSQLILRTHEITA